MRKTGGNVNTQWVALAMGCMLVVALLTGALVLYETKALWHMDSPNAIAWNATLNGTATGFDIIPIFIIVIVIFLILGFNASARGFE